MNLFKKHLISSWQELLKEELSQNYIHKIESNLLITNNQNKNIFPKDELIFNAFNLCKVDDIKVVILGQDPYHKAHQAMGLSFSVPKTVKIPPSLRNIYREIKNDIGGDIPTHGDLTSWAEQGVLLLNAILTVTEGQPASHRKVGWQQFTDQVIARLSIDKDHLVFMLWGNFAKEKASLIDETKHLILTSAHPSPLARGAFFGNNHFSKANEYLINHNRKSIHWMDHNPTLFN